MIYNNNNSNKHPECYSQVYIYHKPSKNVEFMSGLQAPQLAGVQFNRPNTALGVQPTVLGQV